MSSTSLFVLLDVFKALLLNLKKLTLVLTQLMKKLATERFTDLGKLNFLMVVLF